MQIILYDAISYGHHTTYIYQFAVALHKANYKVAIFSPNIDFLKENIFGEHSKLFSFTEIEEDTNEVSRWRVLNRWRKLKKTISYSGITPSLVFLCWADDFRFRKDHSLLDKLFIAYINFCFPYQWAGLYFHPIHLRILNHPLNSFKNYSIDRVFSCTNCIAVCTLDEGIKDSLEKETGKPVILFPDITNEDSKGLPTVLATKVLEKAGKRKIVLLIGMLQKRKGLLTMLAASLKLPANKFFFVLVGPLVEQDFTDEELQYISQFKEGKDNIFYYNNMLPDGDEFNGLVKASDIIYAVYKEFPHSSNIMTKSTLFAKPILVNKGYLMEERVLQHKIGAAVNGEDITSVIDGLYAISSQKFKKDDFENYYTLHNKDAIFASWDKLLKHIE